MMAVATASNGTAARAVAVEVSSICFLVFILACPNVWRTRVPEAQVSGFQRRLRKWSRQSVGSAGNALALRKRSWFVAPAAYKFTISATVTPCSSRPLPFDLARKSHVDGQKLHGCSLTILVCCALRRSGDVSPWLWVRRYA